MRLINKTDIYEANKSYKISMRKVKWNWKLSRPVIVHLISLRGTLTNSAFLKNFLIYLWDIILMLKEIGSFLHSWVRKEILRDKNEISIWIFLLKGYYLNHISILLAPYQLHKEIHWEACLYYHSRSSFFWIAWDFTRFRRRALEKS